MLDKSPTVADIIHNGQSENLEDESMPCAPPIGNIEKQRRKKARMTDHKRIRKRMARLRARVGK